MAAHVNPFVEPVPPSRRSFFRLLGGAAVAAPAAVKSLQAKTREQPVQYVVNPEDLRGPLGVCGSTGSLLGRYDPML